MPIRGVWMWPGTVESFGAVSVVSCLARAGITDLVFLVKGLAGTVSFQGAAAPACSDRDLLRELLDASHARGLRVHAWLTSACDDHYKQLHPESGRCHYVRGRDKGFISLTDEGYLAYMTGIVQDLCRRYEIDGLHLDYIRYNHLLYGWDGADLKRYAASGADPAHLKALMDRTFLQEGPEHESCIFDALRAGDPDAEALARTRRADVRRFAGTLCGAARSLRPGLCLSAALMPEGAYTDTAFADLHYGQSYDDAAALYDLAFPMAYSKAYEKDGAWVRSVVEGTRKHGLKTVAGLHAYEGATGPSLREDLNALAGSGAEGFCLFRAGSFLLALPESGRTRLVNLLDRPVTALRRGGLLLCLPEPVLPGKEKLLSLPAGAEALRAFSGEQEVCVWEPGADVLS